jgi:isocitrate/methylisocitrate lyase
MNATTIAQQTVKQPPDPAAAADALARDWATNPRWQGIRRTYGAADVVRLRGSVVVEHSLARLGAERLWDLLGRPGHVSALGALTGGQAVQMVKAGLDAIYLSGWQVAADANLAGHTYPDQSLYPANSVPAMVRRINNALRRADQIDWAERLAAGGGAAPERRNGANGAPANGTALTGTAANGMASGGAGANGRHARPGVHWLAPIMADAEAGFGGTLNAFELMTSMIEAGAAGVHFEDQLASEKKCGHLGGKVLVPTNQFIRTLTAARLAADVAGVPTVLVARTDSLAATLLTTDVDADDARFVTGERTGEGFYRVTGGMDAAIARGLAYAPYADLLWMETSTPDLGEARAFADAIHASFPGKPLMYNCSPSFNWKRSLDDAAIATFHRELEAMGYKFQFITLAGFHALNEATFELASGFAERAMPAYVELQERELGLEPAGYTATRHQREVGTGWFDEVSTVISNGASSTIALVGSTEADQF